MPTIKFKAFIIGLLVLIGLSIQVDTAKAIYSPSIASRVSLIKQHVNDAQAQNGNGSVLEAIESIKAYDKAKREEGDETGVSTEARLAQELIFNQTEAFLVSHPMDSLFMIFNFEGISGSFISDCLRNDIWGLEKLRDLVGAEMVKAYLNRDSYHGNQLKKDYSYLSKQITLLREHGGNPLSEIKALNEKNETVAISSHEYFFGNEISCDPKAGEPCLNYYSLPNSLNPEKNNGCPIGAFSAAINEVKDSWELLKVTGSGSNVEWGNIWQMAKANARIRAKEWIKKNQVSLTIGGEEGGNLSSLTNGGGWEQFVAKIETEGEILERMVGLVTPIFDKSKWIGVDSNKLSGLKKECAFYDEKNDKFRACSDTEIIWYDYCKKDRKLAESQGLRCDRFVNTKKKKSISELSNEQQKKIIENKETKKEVKNAFIYQVTLDSVAEQALYEYDRILWEMNMEIKRGYEGVDSQAGKNVPSLVDEMEAFSKRQCPNKS